MTKEEKIDFMDSLSISMLKCSNYLYSGFQVRPGMTGEEKVNFFGDLKPGNHGFSLFNSASFLYRNGI